MVNESSESLCCPFCKEDDFDLIGLKGHLIQGRCKEFNVIEIRTSLFGQQAINELAKKCCGFLENTKVY